jgi:dolichyl-phosphate-mannose--protein O-mannosyl transferase
MFKIQIFKNQNSFEHLDFGHWNLFRISDLGFGILVAASGRAGSFALSAVKKSVKIRVESVVMFILCLFVANFVWFRPATALTPGANKVSRWSMTNPATKLA